MLPHNYTKKNQNAHYAGQQPIHQLCNLDNRTAFHSVAQDSTKQRHQQKAWCETHTDEAGDRIIACQIVNKYSTSDHLHLDTPHGKDHAEPQQPEVTIFQRLKSVKYR